MPMAQHWPLLVALVGGLGLSACGVPPVGRLALPEIGVVDEVVDPKLTRRAVALVHLDTPGVRGQHGNIPL